MKRFIVLISILVAIVNNASAQRANLADDLQSLVETERAFARTASEKGVRDSFLAFIADDGILYRPGPVNGKKWLMDRPARPGLLRWQPVYADISASGDLGFTTGPWEFRPNGPEDTPVAFGQFSSVWHRQVDGTWKFLMDIGIEHEKPLGKAIPWQLPTDFNRKKVTSKSDVDGLKAKLMVVDENFSNASTAAGVPKAYAEFGEDDIRLLRNGSFPYIGKIKAISFFESRPGSLSWHPTGAFVAGSGDLCVTYGDYEFKSNKAETALERGHYMRVWRKQSKGGWKVVLDVFNELPEPSGN